MTQLFDFSIVMNTPKDRIEFLMEKDQIYQQGDLAERLGYESKTTISKHLNSKNISAIFLQKLQDVLGWSAHWIRTGQGPQRINRAGHDESVNTHQGGINNANTSSVTYKGGGASADDEIQRLKQELQAERIKALERERELLQEINELLKNKR